MQTKKHSLLESLSNIGIGYSVAIVSQLMVFPLFGIDVPLSSNLLIGLWFTGISLIRGYLLRRIFNRWTIQNAETRQPTEGNDL